MRILIGEDDPIARNLLRVTLESWNYDVLVTNSGSEAWDAIQNLEMGSMVILDWMMPGMDGVNICRNIRASERQKSLYVLLLTIREGKDDTVKGLEAGADDYLTKPYDPEELRARIKSGERVIRLQSELADRVGALEEAISHVRTLQGFIPICTYCKNIRSDEDSWQQLEKHIMDHSEAQFNHGICPNCYETVVRPELEAYTKRPPGPNHNAKEKKR